MTETPSSVLKQEFDVILLSSDIEVILGDPNSIELRSSEVENIVKHVSNITTVNMQNY
jgi:hypothetical protein